MHLRNSWIVLLLVAVAVAVGCQEPRSRQGGDWGPNPPRDLGVDAELSPEDLGSPADADVPPDLGPLGDLGPEDAARDLGAPDLGFGDDGGLDLGLDVGPDDLGPPPVDAGEPDLGPDDLGLDAPDLGDPGPDLGAEDLGFPDSGPGDVGPADLGFEDLGDPDLGVIEPDDPLVVTFIDVGQGDSILLQMPSGEAILIDGGDNGHGEDDVLPALAERGIDRLDLMVLTHPHADHAGGLDEVLDAIDVDEIWENGETSGTVTYGDFADARDDEGAALLVPTQDLTRHYGDVQLRVLNTGEGHTGYNNDSLVIQLRYGELAILLTGDVETEEQRDLYEDYGEELWAPLVKIPHHGSDRYYPQFVAAAAPELAVICVGEGNRYDHPHEVAIRAYQGAGATVCRTDMAGTITAWTDGQSLEWDCAAPEP